LLIPALLCLGILVVARFLHPRPQELEELSAQRVATRYLQRPYWIYLGGGALIAAGFADFALIGFHFQRAHTVPTNLIPVFYAGAMATSALAALLFGRLFDKFGGNIGLLAFFISAASAPFVFLSTSFFALLGMIFWGVGMSAQGSLLQAMLTSVIPPEKRSTAFGLFDTGLRDSMVSRQRSDGIALREIHPSRCGLFSGSAACCASPFFVANKKL
jgi:predicted MFS family arabinose efflux permease